MILDFQNKEKINKLINEIEALTNKIKKINFEQIEFNDKNVIDIMNNSNLITELTKKVYDLNLCNSVILKNSSAGTDELKIKLLL